MAKTKTTSVLEQIEATRKEVAAKLAAHDKRDAIRAAQRKELVTQLKQLGGTAPAASPIERVRSRFQRPRTRVATATLSPAAPATPSKVWSLIGRIALIVAAVFVGVVIAHIISAAIGWVVLEGLKWGVFAPLAFWAHWALVIGCGAAAVLLATNWLPTPRN